MNGAQRLSNFRRFFVPVWTTVNGSQQFSARANRPGLFGVNRGDVVKQFAGGGILYQPGAAAVFRVLNHSRLADRPTDLIVRKGHPQEDRIGQAQSGFHRVRSFVLVPARRTLRLHGLTILFNRQTRQSSRFPIPAAIIASQTKDTLALTNLVGPIEQPIFSQEQSAIRIKEPDVIQRFALVALWQRPAGPFRSAVFGRQKRSVGTHRPPVIAVNEADASEFRERSARLRAPFRLLT